MFESPAYAASAGTAATGAAGLIVNVLPFIAILVIFYVLMIRPQQRQMKTHREMIAGVKPRDVAVTTGGLIGKVTKVDENEIELEIAQNVRVRVVKSMLSDVKPYGSKPAND
ncbi:preprotein translocase subunit YajC [Sphingosinicella ginsenosidimutans]|uniref:Sec translocon accessory complex subunit YajC n=1 Tax=Allosphingosinicella ginsenosidimutans TaxID=1176539 RepID=A0A5C6TR01_9SPHN|nr:preprotein translocase subunit YajC [Sphingosinicella ginsenosidimutans]TXC62882.1 preprotein translocase subunit YajC [Sphingosinicella ginsenosidimutans]